jgi:outer membrane protein OmpA-like peptidoglycan-associated protein
MLTSSLLRVGALSGAAVVLALGSAGCATRHYVRDQVAQEDIRVGQVDTHVNQVDQHVGQVEGTAKDALDRANAAHKLAQGKFLYEVVLSDDSVKFPTDVHKLSTEAQARLDELATKLKGENQNVYLEIQGHTDARGSEAYNDQLGTERAEAVRRYLNQQGVALNRMSTISYGKDSPVAPNDTREGRAQNRRVVVVVLS